MNENIKLGQEKRIKKLQEKGLYHVPKIEKFICKHCGNEYEYDVNIKRYQNKYLQSGYCSSKCYSESGEKQKEKIKTELINAGYNITNEMSIDEIKILYKEFYSLRYKNKNIKEKWHKSVIDNNGKDSFVKAGVKGYKNFKIKFIKEHELADDVLLLSENEINEIFKNNYNKITNIGELIKSKRLEKYNNDYELYKKSYIDGLEKTFINKAIKDNIKIDNLSDEELQEVISKYKKEYSKSVSLRLKNNVKNWKLAHLKNANIIECEILDDETINNLYHDYLVNRIQKLQNVETNGYKRTKKGWYKFINISSELFYRSSWELETYKVLDDLYEYIKNVSMPEGIEYYYDNVIHKYFADIKVETLSGKIIYIEIKPERKINDAVNVCKFDAARKKFDNFYILTENEIFNKNFKNILYEIIK